MNYLDILDKFQKNKELSNVEINFLLSKIIKDKKNINEFVNFFVKEFNNFSEKNILDIFVSLVTINKDYYPLKKIKEMKGKRIGIKVFSNIDFNFTELVSYLFMDEIDTYFFSMKNNGLDESKSYWNEIFKIKYMNHISFDNFYLITKSKIDFFMEKIKESTESIIGSNWSGNEKLFLFLSLLSAYVPRNNINFLIFDEDYLQDKRIDINALKLIAKKYRRSLKIDLEFLEINSSNIFKFFGKEITFLNLRKELLNIKGNYHSQFWKEIIKLLIFLHSKINDVNLQTSFHEVNKKLVDIDFFKIYEDFVSDEFIKDFVKKIEIKKRNITSILCSKDFFMTDNFYTQISRLSRLNNMDIEMSQTNSRKVRKYQEIFKIYSNNEIDDDIINKINKLLENDN